MASCTGDIRARDAMPESPTSPASAASNEATDIVLLAFNRPAHLVRMVEAIEQRTRHPYRLTIVDNGSEADLRAWLHDERDRFHQVVFNRTNLHLAGLQVGIERTASARYVVSDADLVPPDLGPDRCWLGELHALMDRHPDFGMVGCRIEGLPMPAWHRLDDPDTKVVDDEIIEGPTGVWLNLISRDALRVPFQSDGMTCHALSRAGYRVGVGVELLCEHLGDHDPEMYPDYLARKNAANGRGSVYIQYPELARVERPPTLAECVLAAPILAELRERGTELSSVLELGIARNPPIASAVEPSIAAVGIGGSKPVAWPLVTRGEHAPYGDQSVDTTIVITPNVHDGALVTDAARIAARRVFVLTPEHSMSSPDGYELRERRPPNDVMLRMAKWADRTRAMRRLIGYSTLERHTEWLTAFEHARFGGRKLRLYECERVVPSPPTDASLGGLRCPNCDAREGSSCTCGLLVVRSGPRPYARPFGRTIGGAIGAKVTQVTRAIGVEWRMRRGS